MAPDDAHNLPANVVEVSARQAKSTQAPFPSPNKERSTSVTYATLSPFGLNAQSCAVFRAPTPLYLPVFSMLCPPHQVATLDHTPKSVTSRTVVIHAEAKSAMTSGKEANKGWRLYWKNAERWTNPLTGWTSSADPMTSVKMTFDTKQQAIDFATKKGDAREDVALYRLCYMIWR
jgi:hypothetical protein